MKYLARIAAVIGAVVWVMAAWAVIAAQEAGWRMAGGDAQHTGAASGRLTPPLSLDWIAESKALGNADISPVSDGSRIYLVCTDQVFALDAATGRQIWKQPATGKLDSEVRVTPALGDKYLYISKLSGEVMALDLSDGSPAWSYKARKANRKSAPVVAGNTVYFGSTDNRVYALDAESGQPVWDNPPELTDDVVSSPLITDELVIVQTSDAYLYAINKLNGQPRWKMQLLQPPTGSSPTISGGTIIAVAGESVFGVDARTGNPKWEVALEDRLTSGPVVANNIVYVGDRKEMLYAISTTGRKLWEQRLDGIPCSNPVALGGSITAPTNKGRIFGFQPDGKLIWRFQVEPRKDSDRFYGGAAVVGDKMYVLSGEGRLYCFISGAYDATGPEITGSAPKVLSRINGTPPIVISGRVTDYGSGVNPASVRVWLDGKEAPAQFDPEIGRFRYETPVMQPVVPLSDGAHTVKVMAADWAGNPSEATWSFSVDNKLPRESKKTGG